MARRWAIVQQGVEKILGFRVLGEAIKRLLTGHKPTSTLDSHQPPPRPASTLSDLTDQSLGMLFYASPVAICVSTFDDGRITIVNDSFLQMTGYSRTEVIGHTNDEIGIQAHIPHHPSLVEFFHQHNSVRNVDATCRTKSGEIRHTLLSAERIELNGRPGTLLLVYDITERKRAEEKQQWLLEQVRASRRQLATLSKRLLEVQENERRQIARELHDEIGQMLTGLKFVLEAAARAPAGTEHRLTEAQSLVNELIARVRNLSLGLRPAMLDDFGLVPALLWLIERYTAQTHIQVDFGHSGLEHRFASEIETAAYRIVQEALNNVARHAHESEVSVRVWVDQDILHLQVEDWGVGFDVEAVLAAGRSGGLTGMRERAGLLGGRFNIESIRGVGTRVSAELPLQGGWLERRQHERNDSARG